MDFLMAIVFDWSCMEQDWKFAINNRHFPSNVQPFFHACLPANRVG